MFAGMSSALSGMRAQETRLAVSANNIANASTPGYRAQRTDMSALPGGGVQATVRDTDGDVDLGSELMEATEASLSYAANAAVFETGADMWEMLMTIVRDDRQDERR